jgi:uncharacterized membrane protein YdjX (TVP38/TMEM64 family)
MPMRRWICLWLLISAAVIVVASLCDGVLHVPLAQTAQSLIAEPGVSPALAIVILLSLDLFLPIPSSLVMILSGAIFGIVGGGMLSLLGLLTGNVAGFELTRRYGMGFAQRLVGEEELHKMDRTFARYGIVAILLSRPVPVMMETLNVLAALSTMSRSTFVLTNFLGTLPICLLYTAAGAFSWQLQSLVPAWLIGLCVPAAGWLVVQKWGRPSTQNSISDPPSMPQRNC